MLATRTNFDLQPVLENDLLIIRPLRPEDFEDVYKVASDPGIWEQHPEKNRCDREVFKVFFDSGIESKGAFAVIDKKTGEIIGSTRFHPVKETQNAIEIGWTFLVRKYWGGYYNKSMKLLLMDYAFRFVENIIFCIHENNSRSRKAVEKLGGELITELENQILEPRTASTVIYKINKSMLIR